MQPIASIGQTTSQITEPRTDDKGTAYISFNDFKPLRARAGSTVSLLPYNELQQDTHSRQLRSINNLLNFLQPHYLVAIDSEEYAQPLHGNDHNNSRPPDYGARLRGCVAACRGSTVMTKECCPVPGAHSEDTDVTSVKADSGIDVRLL